MKNRCIWLLLWCFAAHPLLASSDFTIDWELLSSLPPAAGQSVQPGLAGPFVGIDGPYLILAGGANFPHGPAWEGGVKEYHNVTYIYNLELESWLPNIADSLPDRIAYGISVQTDDGIFCTGGTDGKVPSGRSFLLHYDGEKLIRKELPSLPIACADMAGGRIGDWIYVAASCEGKHFWRINTRAYASGWERLTPWPGSNRSHAMSAVQSNGEEECFYLIKGRHQDASGVSQLHADIQIYQPSTDRWIGVHSPDSSLGQFSLSAGTAIAMGATHILLLGGADGVMLNRLESLGQDIASGTTSDVSVLEHVRDSLMQHHSGFSRKVWSFNTVTHAWSVMDSLPQPTQVTTTALRWGDEILVPSGEISPCIRTPAIYRGTLASNSSFGYLNTAVLIIYLLVLVGMGIRLSRRQSSTEDFFLGGKRIPWWAAGLSIFGTQLSAITFMAIPAKTYATDWLYFFLMMTIIMIAPIIIRYFLPFYRKHNVTTAYEYLEIRFNLTTRLVGSAMYLLLQFGRLAIVLLLPSIALSVVTGIDVHLCILVMGLLSILYTVLGGMEAVIWTDVLQVFVLLGGALLSLFLLANGLEFSEIKDTVLADAKVKIFDFVFDFSTPTLWVVLIGGLASNLVQYGSDQTVVQRYLTTSSEKEAAKSIWIGAWMTLPATLIFFSLGTLLYVFYALNPEALAPTLPKVDAVFPWYIVSQLPDGICGLLIAAIFAASMSSLDSSMNSVATVVTTDYRRLAAERSEPHYLRFARWVTVAMGLLGIAVALGMASSGIPSLWDQFNLIVGLFAGGLGGVFLLGIFSKHTHGSAAVLALLGSAIVQYWVSAYTDIHFLLYAFTGVASCIFIGVLLGRIPINPQTD